MNKYKTVTGLKFSRLAFRNNIAVTSVNVKHLETQSYEIDVCLNQTSPSLGVLINSKCRLFESIVTYASRNILFDTNHKWLILHEYDGIREVEDVGGEEYTDDNSDDNVQFLSIFRHLNLSVNADIVVATNNDLGHCTLYDVYNFGKNRDGRFVIEIIGNWNTVTGLNLTRKAKFYRRFNYHQMVLKLILVLSPPPKTFEPKMILTWSPASNVPIVTQTASIFLNEIADIHNIRYNYTVVDTWIGNYNKEQAYSISKGLYFKEHDVTPVLRQLPSHFDKYDVTFPVTSIETRYFYRIPSSGIGKFENQFLKPLSWEVWLSVLGISVLCGMVLLLSTIMEGQRPISLGYAIFSILALICQQFFEETEDLRRVSSVRKFTILVTGLSCLLIYNYYTSSVVSWLLSAPPPSINSLWELLDSPLKPVFQDTGFTYSWLQLPDYYFDRKYAKAEEKLKERMLNLKKKGKPILKSLADGITLVKGGGYVYHGEVEGTNKIIAQTFNQREMCDLGSIRSMAKSLLYVTVQKRSPYKKFFTWSSLRLMETGVLNRIHRRTRSRDNRCEGSSPRALALGGAAPAFILLVLGYLIAFFVVLTERFIWHHRMRISTYTN